MKRKIFGGLLVIIGLATVLTVTYVNTRSKEGPLVFAGSSVLDNLWNAYKSEYVEPDTGRAVDRQRENITTSEGQSYTMLRAVWQDDRATFDKSWEWTRNNLKRPEDKLFSWMWGKKSDGSYGVLNENGKGGQNTATDGDSDIAVALLFAAERYQDPQYRDRAEEIISDIWEKEVVQINNRPILAANNLEKQSSNNEVVVNPSYFSPYAYRMFAAVDKGHDWEGVIDSSYDLIMKSTEASIDQSESANLPPNWFILDKQTGNIKPPTRNGLNTDYGYDAMRLPWRLALDKEWYNEPRAEESLKKLSFLSDEWRKSKTIAATYSHDGRKVGDFEAPAIYGGTIGYFTVVDPTLAGEVYESKLKSLYDPDSQSWKQKLSYYDDNWAWFGLGLYQKDLPNLAKNLTDQT